MKEESNDKGMDVAADKADAQDDDDDDDENVQVGFYLSINESM